MLVRVSVNSVVDTADTDPTTKFGSKGCPGVGVWEGVSARRLSSSSESVDTGMDRDSQSRKPSRVRWGRNTIYGAA